MINNQDSLIVRVADDIQKLYSAPGQVQRLRSSLGRRDWDDKAVLLQDILKLPILNYSDFNYDLCYTYSIIVAPALYRTDHVLLTFPGQLASREEWEKIRITDYIDLRVSPLGYYTFSHDEKKYDKNKKYIGTLSHPFGSTSLSMNRIKMEIEMFFEKRKDYILLNDSILMRQVLGVKLDLSDEDKVVVFKCLFSDSDGGCENNIGPPIVDLRHT